MLVENTIKHNVISADKPLTIKIETKNDTLIVTNNLQPKQTMNDSNGIGLNNIVHRYSLLTSREVEITNDGIIFSVALPLL